MSDIANKKLYILNCKVNLNELRKSIIQKSTFRQYINTVDSYMNQKQYEDEYRDNFDEDVYKGWYWGLSCALDNILSNEAIWGNIWRLINVRSDLNLDKWDVPYITKSVFCDSYNYVIDFLKHVINMDVTATKAYLMGSTVTITLSDTPGNSPFNHNLNTLY